jgi:hypothetical protein
LVANRCCCATAVFSHRLLHVRFQCIAPFSLVMAAASDM